MKKFQFVMMFAGIALIVVFFFCLGLEEKTTFTHFISIASALGGVSLLVLTFTPFKRVNEIK